MQLVWDMKETEASGGCQGAWPKQYEEKELSFTQGKKTEEEQIWEGNKAEFVEIKTS